LSKIALCVNPMSGRDVRRLAARASNMTHEAKRDIVARIAAGADSMGVSDIYVMREPFRIAELALEHMPLSANVHILDAPIKNDSRDTQEAIHRFIQMGCRTIVSLGGDGTNRAIVKSTSEIDLIPLSTGTNNVFPLSVEPTLAGIVAGLNAVGKITDDSLKSRSKVIYIESAGIQDIALIDLVLLSNDLDDCIEEFGTHRLGIRLALDKTEPKWGGRMLFFRAGKFTLEIIQNNSSDSQGKDHFWGIAYLCSDIELTIENLQKKDVVLSSIREGRKKGTLVATVKSHNLGLPTLLIQNK